MTLNQISDVEIHGVDRKDYPDFCDAFVASAKIDGRPATDEECEQIQTDFPDFFYDTIMETYYR